MENIVIVIQARMGSTRLPGKVMLPLAGKPLLVQMVERVQSAALATTVVVATTPAYEDDVIEFLCLEQGFHCFRGHPTNLLDRHYQAGLAFGATAVVKIPSDCPLIDPNVIDKVLTFYANHRTEYDFVSNLHPASFPDGNDVEVIPMDVLETAWSEAQKPHEREHATPFIWDNPERFRIGNVRWESSLDYSMTHRWTIDYPEDYAFIEAVYQALYPRNHLFTLNEILALLRERPDIAALNSHYAGVNWYRNNLSDLKTIDTLQTRLIES